ncbi:MAG: 50S ribosomal protein L25 [Desulfobacterales bacterium]|nr:50S ribosomal protein L25 [Desulfobacteraceae bacterium]MDD3991447.1 50S ribosomal protein L25 [Desulfobacteraceae bacterium]MDY0311661.1 50S ribosomal protein L25 [Desulfobacterales bacterium]
MEFIALSTKPRTRTGKGGARAQRREGRTPAVLYGPNTETRMLSVDTVELENTLKKHPASRTVFKLALDDDTGSTENLAMLKELQDNPLNGALLHADFYRIDLDRKVSVQVPVITTGKAKGVELGGMLQLVRRELTVHCLPDRIPRQIEIDITDLGIGEAVHVEDIQLGEAVEIPHDVNFTIVTVLSTRKADADEEEGTEVEEGAEQAPGEQAEA